MLGTTVSHYRILEKLGEGGMGVVYKAHDTELDRAVALKFLPHRSSIDESEQARFLQEARAAAILNHPNICTVHAIETSNDERFIVMEYIDGRTLRELIGTGRLRINDCIAYAIEICEALQEAHSKGIVHRDIKADNIMVNSKNHIKVMDFGLAKLKGSLKLTKSSSTVGTLAYMSPEQIQGGEADIRSDIFSFGVVLYEMLTGHMPFRGEHEAAMIYSIVNENPTPVQAYLPDVSSELFHIVNRALEKDPEERYQTAHDMVIDLRRLKKETTRVVRPVEALSSVTEKSDVGGPRLRSKKLIFVFAAGFVALCVVTVFLLFRGGPGLNPDMQSRMVQIPFRNVSYASLSRDGNWIAFPAADDRGKFDVYMMNVSQGEPRRITSDSCYFISNVSLSPDASTIIYSRLRSSPMDPLEVVSVSSLGGIGRIILDHAYFGKWLADGQRVGYVAQPLLPVGGRKVIQYWSCNPNGSDRRLELVDTVVDMPNLRIAAVLSPDRKYMAWTKNFPEGYTEIMIRNREKGTDRRLTHDRKFADDPLWSNLGYIFYSSNRGGNINVWMIPESGGKPTQVTRGSGPDSPLGITADGQKLMYSEIQDLGQVKSVDFTNGNVRQLTVSERLRGASAISPSGKYIAVPAQEIDAISPARNIYVMDRNGENVRKMTDDESYKTFPSWSPDERWITYSARPGNEPEDSSRVYLIRADGPSRPKLMGRGTYSTWFNEKEFVLWSFAGTYRRAIDRDKCIGISGDSVFAIPVLDEKYIVFLDWHIARAGWWIVEAMSYSKSGTTNAARLTGKISYAFFPVPIKRMFYVPLGSGELHSMSLPDAKDRLVRRLPGLDVYFSMSVSGNEMAYTETYRKIRFVMIDKLFK